MTLPEREGPGFRAEGGQDMRPLRQPAGEQYRALRGREACHPGARVSIRAHRRRHRFQESVRPTAVASVPVDDVLIHGVGGRGSGTYTTVVFSVDVTESSAEPRLEHLSIVWATDSVGLKTQVTSLWPSFPVSFSMTGTLPAVLPSCCCRRCRSSRRLLFISLQRSEFLDGGELEFS